MGIFGSKKKDPDVAGLKAMGHPDNPRTITDDQLERLTTSMTRYGDLSGIVFNLRTGRVVCGHQRLKAFGEDARIEYADNSGPAGQEKPDDHGTLKVGWIIEGDDRWPYRVVDVEETIETEMMIAANAHGGDWNFDVLQHQMEQLKIATAAPDKGKGPDLLRQLKAHQKKKEAGEQKATDASRVVHKCPACGNEWSAKS